MTVPTIKRKKISRHKTGDKEYPRITITGDKLSKLGWDIGDEVVVLVDFSEEAEFAVKIKKEE